MRQPEVTRLAGLALALVLVLPVGLGAHSLLLATAFSVEFLTQGARRPLSALTPAPQRSSLPVQGAAVDRYVVSGRGGDRLVLVHGLSPGGKDDPRLAEAAALLARAGFDVAVPTIPGLTRGRLRPSDVQAVVATVAAGRGRTTLVGVSVGAGPAVLAAADPRVRDRVATVLCLGGYASARELVRFYLSGEYRYGDRHGTVAHDPEEVREFVEANADLLDAPMRRGLSAGRVRDVDRLFAELSPDVQRLLDRLSPELAVREVRARLILVHGRSDPAVPYTESLRLAAARPERTRVVLLGVVDHVEGRWPARRNDLLDLARLWSVVYDLLAVR